MPPVLRDEGKGENEAFELRGGLTRASLNTPHGSLSSNPLDVLGSLKCDNTSFFSCHGSRFSQSLAGVLPSFLFPNYHFHFNSLKSSACQRDSLEIFLVL